VSLIFNPAFISRRLPIVKTPTTWNPSDKASGVTLSNGNLTAQTPTSGGSGVRSVASVSSGKWYWEMAIDNAGSGNVTMVGIATSAMPIASGIPGFSADSYGYRGGNGQKYTNSSGVAYGAATATGDVVSVLLDMDNNQIEFWKNGASQGVAFTGLGAGPFFPSVGDVSSSVGATFTANFGQSPFVYDRPWDYFGGLGAV
jgi:hypothetical protein